MRQKQNKIKQIDRINAIFCKLVQVLPILQDTKFLMALIVGEGRAKLSEKVGGIDQLTFNTRWFAATLGVCLPKS